MQPQHGRDVGRNHGLHTRSIERVVRVMSERLHLPMSNEEMADIACFSPCHFNRLFHKITGIPPIQFHYALRIAQAKELLIETDLGITDICFDVGYNSLGTFISRFNELVGISPSGFRHFARRMAGLRVADVPFWHAYRAPDPQNGCTIAGRIDDPGDNDFVFTGLFRRAIPQGRPAACSVLLQTSRYELPVPCDGVWHVLSVGVWGMADAVELLTLKKLARGRSAPLLVQDGACHGDSAITLLPPSLLDPPILAALPIQAAREHSWRMSPPPSEARK